MASFPYVLNFAGVFFEGEGLSRPEQVLFLKVLDQYPPLHEVPVPGLSCVHRCFMCSVNRPPSSLRHRPRPRCLSAKSNISMSCTWPHFVAISFVDLNSPIRSKMRREVISHTSDRGISPHILYANHIQMELDHVGILVSPSCPAL
jgi:hypothetical protein